MAEATFPVDLRNPGQVFACLGLMEAAEILCGPCEGVFDYGGFEIETTFTLAVAGAGNAVERPFSFFWVIIYELDPNPVSAYIRWVSGDGHVAKL